MYNFLKEHKLKIISAFFAVAVLIAAFCLGGRLTDSSPKTTYSGNAAVSQTIKSETVSNAGDEKAVNDSSQISEAETKESLLSKSENITDITQNSTVISQQKTSDSSSQQNKNQTQQQADKSSQKKTATNFETSSKTRQDSVYDEKSKPAEPQKQQDNSKLTCTVSINCGTILDNMSMLDSDKKGIIPKNGWILKPEKVTFNEGESAFDILQKVCREKSIHMESSWTPVYDSAYIEGINNIYEFDCGDRSGWKYCVNNYFPNYGCSRYAVKKNDIIEWKYTCDSGYDIGGGYASGQ